MFTSKPTTLRQFAQFQLSKQQALKVKGGNDDTIIEDDFID